MNSFIRSGSETILHTFTGGRDGGNPDGGLIKGGNGFLYGTAWAGDALELAQYSR